MRSLRSHAQGVAAIVFVATLLVGGLAPNVGAAATPDRSDVVLVLDFSASILVDKTTRNRFGAALERIAARVDETAADLVAGDTTVTIIQFATRAAEYPNCADLKLLNSKPNVARLADCLRAVAGRYRKGVTTTLSKQIGVDTNYVAAMEAAAKHLPLTAIRPALILFTDGKHDVADVPATAVQPARDRLFGSRTPFALLPVGMGLDPKNRVALAAGLEALKIVRDMPACVSGATFDWPTVVFETADAAGNAVAVALQDATCTFTVAPTPAPTPTPMPTAVQAIKITPGDGKIELAWAPPASKKVPVVDYMAHCRAGDGPWIESTEGVSLEPTATVEGLTNGTEYRCEIAAIGAGGTGNWTPASIAVTPVGRPAAPAKPIVSSINGGVMITEPIVIAGVDRFVFECSSDGGTTWSPKTDVSASDSASIVDKLKNGTNYVCRAFATNAIGTSDASPVSDVVRPCGSALECNAALLPILGGLGFLVIGGLIVAVIALILGRTRGYVVAVVDTVHTANIGHGSSLGIAFLRAPGSRTSTGIVAARGRKADVRIRRLRGGRFEVRDKFAKKIVGDGDAMVVADSTGVRHSLVLRAFATNAASEVAGRR